MSSYEAANRLDTKAETLKQLNGKLNNATILPQYTMMHSMEATDGRKIWYIAECSGWLMEVDIPSKILKCIWRVPDADYCRYRSMFYHDGKLYIIPYYDKWIYIYDLGTTKYESIGIKGNMQLIGYIGRENYIYIFGQSSQIVKFHLLSNEITYIDIKSDEIGLDKNFQIHIWNSCFAVNDDIYAWIQGSNLIIKVDSSDNVAGIRLGELPQSWLGCNIVVRDNIFHAICLEGKLNDVSIINREYDMGGKLITEYRVNNSNSCRLYPFSECIYRNGQWLCLPFGREVITLIDHETQDVIYRIDDNTKELQCIMDSMIRCFVMTDNHMFYSIDQSRGSLITIELDSLKIKHDRLELIKTQGDDFNRYYKAVCMRDGYIEEYSQIFPLESYVHYIREN